MYPAHSFRWPLLTAALVAAGLALGASARRIARRVVVASPANLGSAPIVPRPLAPVLERRSRMVRDALHRARQACDADFVDFCLPGALDRFRRSPDLCLGPDSVHPSGDCYDLCVQVIERRTGLAAALGHVPPP